VPDATICLLSALVFHELTTQLPPEVWIALPAGRRAPILDTVRIRVARFTGKALTEGRQQNRLEGVPVHIYCPAKTVADCFKFRNKIGLDVALEALRNCLRSRRATVSEINHYAEICRVARIMRPYLEAIA
jgi:predicted transcriptional regulator of viral defense system